VHGLPATNGSPSLAGFVAAEDCACAAPPVEAGAIIVGKTSNPEFCFRGVTSNDLWGETRDPHDPSRTAGGPSGGAAASASGMVPLAIGTGGSGSIRIPSAFCGTTGLKPTFGLIPKMPGRAADVCAGLPRCSRGSGTVHHYLAQLLPRLRRVAHPEHARHGVQTRPPRAIYDQRRGGARRRTMPGAR
jgi:Amidase